MMLPPLTCTLIISSGAFRVCHWPDESNANRPSYRSYHWSAGKYALTVLWFYNTAMRIRCTYKLAYHSSSNHNTGNKQHVVSWSIISAINTACLYNASRFTNIHTNLIMAVRQHRPPAILFYQCCSLNLSFFRRLVSEVAWPIVTKLCHMFDGDPFFKIQSEIWVAPSPLKFGGPKTSKFRGFRDLIRNISGTQDIVSQKNSVGNYRHWLPHRQAWWVKPPESFTLGNWVKPR